uniref:Uncharacterized protein n=1 Tax=Rhabditophanes sp. KR3021 TaxID=114890 RepID=A0AC35UBS3_9BILA
MATSAYLGIGMQPLNKASDSNVSNKNIPTLNSSTYCGGAAAGFGFSNNTSVYIPLANEVSRNNNDDGHFMPSVPVPAVISGNIMGTPEHIVTKVVKQPAVVAQTEQVKNKVIEKEVSIPVSEIKKDNSKNKSLVGDPSIVKSATDVSNVRSANEKQNFVVKSATKSDDKPVNIGRDLIIGGPLNKEFNEDAGKGNKKTGDLHNISKLVKPLIMDNKSLNDGKNNPPMLSGRSAVVKKNEALKRAGKPEPGGNSDKVGDFLFQDNHYTLVGELPEDPNDPSQPQSGKTPTVQLAKKTATSLSGDNIPSINAKTAMQVVPPVVTSKAASASKRNPSIKKKNEAKTLTLGIATPGGKSVALKKTLPKIGKKKMKKKKSNDDEEINMVINVVVEDSE